MIFSFLVLAGLLVSVWAISLSYKTEGMYSTVFFFVVGATVYFLALPLEMIFTGKTGYPVSDVFFITAEPFVFYKIFFLGLMAIFGFTYGYKFSGFTSCAPDRYRLGDIPDFGGRYQAFELAMFLLWLASLIILLPFYGQLFHVIQSYTASYTLLHANPLISFMLTIASLLNAILALFLMARKKLMPMLAGLFLLAANVVLSILIYKKGPAIASILAMGYACFLLAKNKKNALLVVILGACLFIFGFVHVFHGFLRSGQVTMDNFVPAFIDIFRVTLTTTDPAGPMGVTILTVKKDAPLLWGKTYLDSLSLFIPRALWPDRPLDIAESFAKSVMQHWKPGQGMGFGPIAEAYMNFGLWGAFIPFLGFGLLWGWTWRGFQKLTDFFQAPLHFDVVYRIVGFFVMVQFFRGFTMGSYKQLVMVMIPFALVFIGMRLLIWLKEQKKPQSA